MIIEIPEDTVPKLQRAIISLCQAATRSENIVAYSDDIYWAMELLGKITAKEELETSSLL